MGNYINLAKTWRHNDQTPQKLRTSRWWGESEESFVLDPFTMVYERRNTSNILCEMNKEKYFTPQGRMQTRATLTRLRASASLVFSGNDNRKRVRVRELFYKPQWCTNYNDHYLTECMLHNVVHLLVDELNAAETGFLESTDLCHDQKLKWNPRHKKGQLETLQKQEAKIYQLESKSSTRYPEVMELPS